MKTTTNIYGLKRTDAPDNQYRCLGRTVPMPKSGARALSRLRAAISSRAVTIVMLTTVVLGMHSCSADDEADADSRHTQTVVLKITPGTPGDLNATRAATDDEAREGEFINTLCVYMVDANGYVEMAIRPDFVNDTNIDPAIREAAAKGNLDEYTSEEFQLTSGRRSFYAFANWGDTEMAQFAAYNIGDRIDRDALNACTLADPASEIDIAGGKYIPMSGMLKEADIHQYLNSNNTIKIPIERLVSRLRVSLTGNSGLTDDIPITSITVSGFADRVTLLPEAALPAETGYGRAVEFNPGDDDLVGTTKAFSAKNGKQQPLGDIYLNETRRREPFKVTMTTRQYGGDVVYNGSTARTELPRNSIFPLSLSINKVEPALKVEFLAPPIGVVMQPIEVQSVDGNTFDIDMYEGATFTITPDMNGITGATYEWERKSVYGDLKDNIDNIGPDGVLEGTLSAIPGIEVEYGFKVEWTSGRQSYSRSYTVNITAIDLSGFKFSLPPAPAPRLLPRETLYLWRN